MGVGERTRNHGVPSAEHRITKEYFTPFFESGNPMGTLGLSVGEPSSWLDMVAIAVVPPTGYRYSGSAEKVLNEYEKRV